ncbi:MAG: hypothetical protein JSW45_08675 [Thiotrichales bacterium]|nr:MAG: hypothetical protein JSW45_08675 [Thiotrichales bacterium]
MINRPVYTVWWIGSRRYSLWRACWLLVLLGVTSPPVWASFDEAYRLTIGGLVTDFDTTLRINSRDNSIDDKIELEEDLGFDSTVSSGFIRGYWRMASRHRLSLLYTQFSRSTELTTTGDLEIDGNIIKAGAFFGSSATTHVFDFEYMYSFLKRPNIELGLTVGLYWLNSVVELTAAGEVIFEGETQPEFKSDYQANQRLIAPLPLIGLTLGYAINDSWNVRATARFFDVTISDIDGYVFSSILGTEYYFTKHVGLGVNYAWFNLSVRHNGVVFTNTLTYEYTGFQGYLTLKY